MRVDKVKMRPGRPMIACEPNSAIELTNAISVPDKIAGATSGAVIDNAVRHLLAPRISAASSYDASTDCSAVTASKYTKGNVCRTVTSTNPFIEKMLKVSQETPNASRIRWLMRPAFGLNRLTKAIAVRNGGDR